MQLGPEVITWELASLTRVMYVLDTGRLVQPPKR